MRDARSQHGRRGSSRPPIRELAAALVAGGLMVSLAGCSLEAPGSAGTAAAATHKATASPSATPTAKRADAEAAIRALWRTNESKYGTASGSTEAIADGFVAHHTNADIYYSRATGAVAVVGEARTALSSGGGVTTLGFPAKASTCITSGCTQVTERGRLYVPTDGTPFAVSADRTPELTTVSNFRDLAGEYEGTALVQGGYLARGVIYRSAVVRPSSDSDKLVLNTLGLKQIIDLRTPGTRAKYPDIELDGVSNDMVNLYGGTKVPGPSGDTVEARITSEAAVYRTFVSDPKRRAALGQVITKIVDTDGAVLFHCSAGKDRTGWTAAVLMLAAGASEGDAMASFLASNDYRAEIIEAKYQKNLAKKGQAYADSRRVDNMVDPSYLNAALDEMTQRYGTLDKFLTEGAGVSEDTLAALKKKLTAA